jgi:hypothetical protein
MVLQEGVFMVSSSWRVFHITNAPAQLRRHLGFKHPSETPSDHDRQHSPTENLQQSDEGLKHSLGKEESTQDQMISGTVVFGEYFHDISCFMAVDLLVLRGECLSKDRNGWLPGRKFKYLDMEVVHGRPIQGQAPDEAKQGQHL